MFLVQINDGVEVGVEIKKSNQRGVWKAVFPSGEEMTLELKGRDHTGNFIVGIDGNDHYISIDQFGDAFRLTDGPDSAKIRVSRAADLVFEQDNNASELVDSKLLISPITGIVLKVYVEPGDQVRAGSPVVMIEAMKMENTLAASADCEIAEVLVSPGDTVFVGAKLVRYR